MTAVGGVDSCKLHPFLIIPAIRRDIAGEIQTQLSHSSPFIELGSTVYLIYASLSLSRQVRPSWSPLILFLSSSAVGSEGYMERGGPVRQTLVKPLVFTGVFPLART